MIGAGPQMFIAEGGNNTLAVTYTGEDNIEILPTNQLFLRE